MSTGLKLAFVHELLSYLMALLRLGENQIESLNKKFFSGSYGMKMGCDRWLNMLREIYTAD